MSEKARRRAHPEAHQAERRIAEAPLRAWDGHVHIRCEAGDLQIPGRWHLDVPGTGRPLVRDASTAQPLPPHHDQSAWRAYLVRLLTMQIPGVQLRVRSASGNTWTSLEVAAPTTPMSVVQIDRKGLVELLGAGARISLKVRTGP
ncbi:hypothetical protein [Gemmatimonas sp.]